MLFKENNPRVAIGKQVDKSLSELKRGAECKRRANYKGGKILVVEDDVLFQEVACCLFRGLGIAVDVVSNGTTAIETANDYDLILLDIGLPDLDGVEACKRIREHAKGVRPIVVMLTAHINSELRVQCISAGAAEFISKPIGQKELARILKKYNL